MLYDVLIFIVSLLVLFKSSEYVISSLVKISRKVGIDEFAAGFLFLAVGTSLPELVVSVTASLHKSPFLSFSNIIGSNIADICLILGLGALIYSMEIKRKGNRWNIEILSAVSAIPLLLLLLGEATFLVGVLLTFMFIGYCILMMRSNETLADGGSDGKNNVFYDVIMFLISLAFLVGSADILVKSCIALARGFAVPEWIIGMTVIAIGTSLPELAVTLQSLKEGRSSLAIGNILGSCITNLTLVLGVSAMVYPIPIIGDFLPAIIFSVCVNLLLLDWILRRNRIDRWAGLLLLVLYSGFIIATGISVVA